MDHREAAVQRDLLVVAIQQVHSSWLADGHDCNDPGEHPHVCVLARLDRTGEDITAYLDGCCRECSDERRRMLAPRSLLNFTGRMIVCSECGDKRCPKAVSHTTPCPRAAVGA